MDVNLTVGDEILITTRGTVERVLPRSNQTGARRFHVRDNGGKLRILSIGSDSGMTVEVIQAAFADGGVYMDADDNVYEYTATGFGGEPGWYQFSRGLKKYDSEADELDYPSRPLTRLDK